MWIAFAGLSVLAIYLAANVARYILSGIVLPWWHPRSVLFTQVLFFAAAIAVALFAPGGFGPKVFALLGLAAIGALAFFVFLKLGTPAPAGPCECCAHGNDGSQGVDEACATGAGSTEESADEG